MHQMIDGRLVPVKGCMVNVRTPDGTRRLARVLSTDLRDLITVQWLDTKEVSQVKSATIACGLEKNWDVLHVPRQSASAGLGEGRVIRLRSIGGHEQVLVDFRERGEIRWMPFQVLRHIMLAEHRYLNLTKRGPDSAERFRLRALAHALLLWNENTGSLGRFDIDPLPHQIHLAHQILASGNLNWLIADDVGLGKTIEVGLIIAALKQRRAGTRVMLITPAGITRQWQDDLKYKFGMNEFQIYGRDFQINDHGHWLMYGNVIASLDQLKVPDRLQSVLLAPPWDLIVFDEAHKLSRRQYGMQFEYSDRFKLAQSLRSRTDNLLFLSATPHQGMKDKFVALLELLRPEHKVEFGCLDVDSSILGKMVFRNRKADVTDIDGNFVFHGQTSKIVKVESTDRSLDFDRLLWAYLRRGYAAADVAPGTRSKAIGFVMTVYRKLAASSVAAIHGALTRRLERLQSSMTEQVNELLVDVVDSRFQGEWEELANSSLAEFFDGEVQALANLLAHSAELMRLDNKVKVFLRDIVGSILHNDKTEKILVFSEYRATQLYVGEALAATYGASSVCYINGSMDIDARRASIVRFEDDAQFLISTEAGGEGINLHRRCHILVNYDLPWNPMRIVQRIGRLYRYGQRQHVLAINLQGAQTADDLIVAKMYERLEQVVTDMKTVSEEFSAQTHSDILGNIVELVDVQSILEEARDGKIERTEARITEALGRARMAAEKQEELFRNVASFDPKSLSQMMRIGNEHIKSFFVGMCGAIGVAIDGSVDGRVTLMTPESVTKRIPGLPRVVDATFDRVLAQASPGVRLLDLDDALVRYMISVAKSYDFQGLTSVLGNYPWAESVFLTIMRWQNGKGDRVRQELHVFSANQDGNIGVNAPEFSDWLLTHSESGERSLSGTDSLESFRKFMRRADVELSARCTAELQPESLELLLAAWCAKSPEP